MRRLWLLARSLGSAAALVLAAGCGGSEPSPDRVRIAVGPFLSHAPFFIAAEEGLFEAQGLEVELVWLLGREGTVALMRGEVDVATHFVSAGLFNSIHRGVRLRVVADKGHEASDGCVANALLGRRELFGDGGTRDLRALAGRGIDYKPAAIHEYWVEALLAGQGLTYADFTLHNVPQAAKLEALRSGGIELAPWSEPYLTQALDAGVGVPLARPTDALPSQQWAFVVYGRRLLDERPDVGERLMVGYLEAVLRYMEGDRRRNAEIVAAYTGLSADLLERACWLPIRTDGRIDHESALRFQEWALAKDYLDRVVPADEFWEPRFIERAAEQFEAAPVAAP